MVLGKLPAPGHPTIWMTVGQGPIVLAVGKGWGCLDIFTLVYPFSPLSPSVWEMARYRLKYCLKGPLHQKTTTQPTKPITDNYPSCISGRRNESVWPDRVSNPGLLTYDSGALPIALCGPACAHGKHGGQ